MSGGLSPDFKYFLLHIVVHQWGKRQIAFIYSLFLFCQVGFHLEDATSKIKTPAIKHETFEIKMGSMATRP